MKIKTFGFISVSLHKNEIEYSAAHLILEMFVPS